MRYIAILALISFVSSGQAQGPLEGTLPLTENGNLADQMVEGIHRYLDRELQSVRNYRTDASTSREKLKSILGIGDNANPRFHRVQDGFTNAKILHDPMCEVDSVRWTVLPGLEAQGLLLTPKQIAPRAFVIAIPDATQTPEELAGRLTGDGFARKLAVNGCQVLIPTTTNRDSELSRNAELGRVTNIPHREFIHRMAYEMGHTLLGYEVQAVLSALTCYLSHTDRLPVAVIGYGDGGRIALYSAALDERISICQISGAFGPQEECWKQPLDRNLFGLLLSHGDAEIGRLIAPRKLIVDACVGPTWSGPQRTSKQTSQAAPGTIAPIATHQVETEFQRMLPDLQKSVVLLNSDQTKVNVDELLKSLKLQNNVGTSPLEINSNTAAPNARLRHKQQFEGYVNFTQQLWRQSDQTRRKFWQQQLTASPAKWNAACEPQRKYFHAEILGKLPPSSIPLNPRSRQVYDEATWTGHEVVLDVAPDIFAYGILLQPRSLQPTDRRPVIVCQHGLEGTPRSCIDAEKAPTYNHFARRLVELGYVVFCPQNPYYGGTKFRQLQRKANPLKLSLFSFIVAQHSRILDWLEKRPGIDPQRIGFYGLSYGGKTVMRVPAIEQRYCLSICSGDFNEWIGKNVSISLDRSYMWTHEYEMYEFNLGRTFNYAELAYLIAPRPFMVERGHNDGVGVDEMVAWEYAKVRNLYANKLRLSERSTIEFFVGGHQIHFQGTLKFIQDHLGKPELATNRK